MYTLVILIGLLLSAEAGKFYLKIDEIKIGVKIENEMKYVPYCITETNSTCIKNFSMCIDDNCNLIESDFSTKPFTIDATSITILSNITWSSDGITKQSSGSTTFDTINTKISTLSDAYSEYSIQMNVTIQCQSDYFSPKCSEIDLCKKLPTGMCQNSGQCTQQDSIVKCSCSDRFSGDYCQVKKNPCDDNLCINNSQCVVNDEYPSKYKCNCPKGFTGQFCSLDINECSNSSICSHLLNSTCVNTYGNYACLCNKPCTSIPSYSNSTDKSNNKNTILDIKWPLSDLATLLLVTIQCALIIVLFLVIIFLHIKHSPPKKTKSKILLDDKYLFIKPRKSKKDAIEFAPNYVRPPIIIEENNQSLAPMFESHDLDNSFNNILSDNNAGMSTFGRR